MEKYYCGQTVAHVKAISEEPGNDMLLGEKTLLV